MVDIQYKVSIGRRTCTDRNESQFIGMHGSRETYEPKYKRNAGGVSYLPSEKIECRGLSYLSAVGARPCASCSPIVSMTSSSHGQTIHQKTPKKLESGLLLGDTSGPLLSGYKGLDQKITRTGPLFGLD